MTQSPTPSLRTVIMLDALVGFVYGAVVSAASGPLSDYTELPHGLLFWAGLSLFPIAALLYLVARRGTESPKAVAAVVLGNSLWVVASVALLLSGKVSMNVPGEVFVLGQALVVLTFTVLEARAARPLFAASGPTMAAH